MKKALSLSLMASLAGCLGGSGDSNTFDNGGDADADADADADGDGDVPRTYPSGPYWTPGEAPGGILQDKEFQGNGSDDTISFGEIYDSFTTNREMLVYALCVS